MITFLTVLHVTVCLFLILVVLLQAGKGGGMGIAFGGGGGSQTVFGSSGAGNFLTRLTSITAFLFLLTSLGLAHFSSQQDSRRLQRLAERKSVEKKADDDRAAKLKVDLEKARESVQKTAGGAAPAPATPATSEPMLPALPAPTLTVPKHGAKPAEKADGESGEKAAPATRRHKRAAAPADGEKPAEAPAPAPAPANE
jgi:preprotein translocase subunit SecG